MKKLYFTFISLILILSISDLHAFVNQRYGWWKLHLKNLYQEKGLLIKNNSIDPSVGLLVDNEIKRTKEMLEIFQRDIKDDGSLKNEKKIFSGPEIKEVINKIAPPLFSIFYLEMLANSTGEKSGISSVKNAAVSNISLKINDRFGSVDKGFLKYITEEEISKTEWQYLEFETKLIKHIKCKDPLYGETVNSIEKNIIREIMARPVPLTLKELNESVIESSVCQLRDRLSEKNTAISNDELNDSWTWHKITKRMDRLFGQIENIRRMIDEAGEETSMMQLKNYYQKSRDLEKVVFEKAKERYFDKRNIDVSTQELAPLGHESYVMKIPKNPDGTLLFKDLDSIRNNAVSLISGKEDIEFFNGMDKKFTNTAQKYLKETQHEFSREEGTLRKLLEKNNSIIIPNRDEFQQAKIIFQDKSRLVNGYIFKSIEFLRWISNSKKHDGVEILASYKDKLEMNKKFIKTITAQFEECLPAAHLDIPFVRTQMAYILKRSGNIFHAITLSISADKKDASFCSASQINEMKNVKSAFFDNLKTCKNNMNRSCKLFVNIINNNLTLNLNTDAGMHEKIAQNEIDTVLKKIGEYSAFYDKQFYSESAFTNYLTRANEFLADTSKDNTSTDLKNALDNKSLFPAVKDFDKNIIKNEYAAKSYIKREIDTDISRLKTLLKFYKQKNIDIKDSPTEEFFKKLHEKQNRLIEISVAGWKMNEKNFEEIDKKIVHKLIVRQRRLSWQKKSGPENRETTAGQIQLVFPDSNISFNIPSGWTEKSLDGKNAENGVIKNFTSLDNEASILIAKVPLDGRSLQEISSSWAKISGTTILKQKWGKKENLDYFWSISKNSRKKVMEIYTLTAGNNAFIISGMSSGERYNFFKDKLDSVFNSIKL